MSAAAAAAAAASAGGGGGGAFPGAAPEAGEGAGASPGGGREGGASPPPAGPKPRKPRAPKALQLADRWAERLPPIEDEDLLVTVAAGLGRRVLRREVEDKLSLGSPDEEVYRRDPECVECLKDLQRLLRRDNASRGAFLRLGRIRLVETDLIPLLVHYPQERDVAYNVLKVLTVLTMPLDLGSDTDQEQAEHLKAVKQEVLSAPDALTNVLSLLARPLAQHPRMTEEDSLTVQLVIVFVRNLLLPADVEEPGWDGKERENVIQCLFDTNVVDLLVAAAQHTDEAPFKAEAPLLLDIFHEIFCGFQPEKLLEAARAERKVLQEIEERDTRRRTQQVQQREVERAMAHSQLKNLLAAEKKQRSVAPRPGARHSRFGGTYLRKYADATSRSMVVRDNPNKSTYTELNHKRPSARAQIAEERLNTPRDSNKLLVRLWNYSKSFLDGSYDILMDVLRSELAHGLGVSRLEPNDFFNFIDLAYFFTRLTRLCVEDGDLPGNFGGVREDDILENAPSPFRHIGATLNLQAITITMNVWKSQADLPPNGDMKDWDMQGVALDLLKEVLLTLNLSMDVGTHDDRKAADKLQRRVLYDDARDTGLLATLIASLKVYPKLSKHQPLSHANSMMETLYAAIKTLERLNEQEAGGFMVRTGRERRGGGGGAAADGTEAGTQAQRAEQGGGVNLEGEGSLGRQPPGNSQFAGGGERVTAGSTQPRMRERALDLTRRFADLISPQFVATLGIVLGGYKKNTHGVNHAVYSLMNRIAARSEANLAGVFWNLSFLIQLDALLSDKTEYDGRCVKELRVMASWIVRELFGKLMPDMESAEDECARDAMRAASELLHVDILFSMDRREAMKAQDGYAFGKAPEVAMAPQQRGLFNEDQVVVLMELWDEHQDDPQLLLKVTEGMNSSAETGANRTWTEDQIRRKLRQLNLSVPRKKRGILTEIQKGRLREIWEHHLAHYNFLSEHEHSPDAFVLVDHIREDFNRSQKDILPRPLSEGQIRGHLKRLGLQIPRQRRQRQEVSYTGGSDSYSSGSEEALSMPLSNIPPKLPLPPPPVGPEDSGSSFSESFQFDSKDEEEAPEARETQEVTSPAPHAAKEAERDMETGADRRRVLEDRSKAAASPTAGTVEAAQHDKDKAGRAQMISEVSAAVKSMDRDKAVQALKWAAAHVKTAFREKITMDQAMIPDESYEFDYASDRHIIRLMAAVGIRPPQGGSGMFRVPCAGGTPHLTMMQGIITGVLDVLRPQAMIDDAALDAGINAALRNSCTSDILEAEPSSKRQRVEREPSEPSDPDLEDPEASLEAILAPTQRTQEGRRRAVMLSDSEE